MHLQAEDLQVRLLFGFIKILEKLQGHSLIFVLTVKITHSVICPGNHQKTLGCGAGLVVFVRHFYGDEVVVRSVNKERRNLILFHGVYCGKIAASYLNGFTAHIVGDPPDDIRRCYGVSV